MQQRIGVLVGMQSEARLAHHLNPVAVEASGATIPGAKAALKRLLDARIDAVVSFGFAAGLDPLLKPGTILLPHSIQMSDQEYIPDAHLRLNLGAETSHIKIGSLLHSDTIVTSAHDKEQLFYDTGCVAVDMESGIVAQYCHEHQLPFAVLRVVCDSAKRDLPPVACLALSNNGDINVSKIIRSLLGSPLQISGLIKLGIDAGIAYRQLNTFLGNVTAVTIV